MGSNNFDVEDFFARHGIDYKKSADKWNGADMWLLTNGCPFDSAHSEPAKVFQYPNGILGFKCQHNGCVNNHWKEFRKLYEPNYESETNSKYDSYLKPARYERQRQAEPMYSEPKSYVAASADSFDDLNVSWLWNGYIPMQEYTAIIAAGGTGKTIACCGFAAFVSTGNPMPGHDPEADSASNVLYISSEDSGELLKTRLKASGADLSKVFILDCTASVGLSFTERYGDLITAIQSVSARLVIIDPWHAFIGSDVDISRVNAIRPVLQQVAAAAKTCNCAILLVSHVNKRAQGENANNTATGSADFINAARAALTIIFDDEPGKKDYRIIVPTKSNYSKLGKSVSYCISDSGGFMFAGYSDVTKETLERAAREHSTVGETVRKRAEDEETESNLIKILCALAIPGKERNVSYDELRDLYGQDIFNGASQPVKVLKRMQNRLRALGITMTTGKHVKYNGKTVNGFSIRKVQFDESTENT